VELENLGWLLGVFVVHCGWLSRPSSCSRVLSLLSQKSVSLGRSISIITVIKSYLICNQAITWRVAAFT